MSYVVFLQPIDEYTSPKNIQLVGEVMNAEELLEEGGPAKSHCDGLTSVTPPRYAEDNMQMLYFESEDVAREVSRMVRDDFINEVSSGRLTPRELPAWSVNPGNLTFIKDAKVTALLPSVRGAFPIESVTDSQLITASESFLVEKGRVASASELLSWIETNRAWELL